MPLHPATTHLPLGLWFSVPVWDLLAMLHPAEPWRFVATATLGTACLFALITVSTGLVDLYRNRRRDGGMLLLVHIAGMGVAWLLCGASLLLRTIGGYSGIDVALSLGGVVAAGGFAHFGGKLVYQRGFGAAPWEQGREAVD